MEAGREEGWEELAQTRKHLPPSPDADSEHPPSAVSRAGVVCGLRSQGGRPWSAPRARLQREVQEQREKQRVTRRRGPSLSPRPGRLCGRGSLRLLLAARPWVAPWSAQATAPSAAKCLPRPAPPHPRRDLDKGAGARLIVSLSGDCAQNVCPASGYSTRRWTRGTGDPAPPGPVRAPWPPP